MDKHIEEVKQYDTEKRLEEVMSTNHYGVHVHAMTKESLHSKSAIAVELAWRDLQIVNLLAKLESAEARLIVSVKLPNDEIGEAASFVSDAEVIPVSIVIELIKATGYPVEGGE